MSAPTMVDPRRAATTSSSSAAPPARNRLVRRIASDRSQRIRHVIQWLFAALNLWIGAEFYLWVRYFECGGHALYVSRPPGVEGWLPIAGLINLKYLLVTGHVSSIHPAAMFLLIAFLAISLLLKKAFCAWLCPIGTLSENLWKLGAHLFGRNFQLPYWADIPLRSLKYLLLGFFVFIIGSMSVQDLAGFMHSPYALVADVKMLDFFLYMGTTAAIVLVLLVALSLFVRNFWCRYLCPYGALMGLASLFSPIKVRRDQQACISCGKCNHACPANLPVDRLIQIRSVECTACMACIAACPAQDALQFALPPAPSPTPAARWRRRVLSPVAVATLLAVIFLGTVFFARADGHWHSHIPQAIYSALVPQAGDLSH